MRSQSKGIGSADNSRANSVQYPYHSGAERGVKGVLACVASNKSVDGCRSQRGKEGTYFGTGAWCVDSHQAPRIIHSIIGWQFTH